jgi:hypothetical protein
MRIKKNIATSEEGFIFNPGTGDSFTTNEIGTKIITMLKEEEPARAIISAICSKYDVDAIQFERDFEDYLTQLKDFAIME